MKYLSLKVLEVNSVKNIITAIKYIEYDESNQCIVIYVDNDFDNIYLEATIKNYYDLVDKLRKNDFVSILNKIAYIQPFNNKKDLKLNTNMKERALFFNKDKKLEIV